MNSVSKALFLVTCLMLGACSKNPFQKYSIEESAQLLSRASEVAMKQLGFNESNMNNRFAQCMEHTAPPSFNCKRLFFTMVLVLNKDGVTASLAQLTDKKLYVQIKEELKLRSYFSL